MFLDWYLLCQQIQGNAGFNSWIGQSRLKLACDWQSNYKYAFWIWIDNCESKKKFISRF